MKRYVMTESLRIQKLGKSLGVILPKRLLEELDVGKGDFLYPSFTGTGVLQSPEDSELSETLDDAHDYMQHHAVAMSGLAENSPPKED